MTQETINNLKEIIRTDTGSIMTYNVLGIKSCGLNCRTFQLILKTMKIFSITHDKFGYDFYLGHIIVANNENEVRELAKKGCSDEGNDIWDVATVTIEGNYTGKKTEPFKLLSDYKAA